MHRIQTRNALLLKYRLQIWSNLEKLYKGKVTPDQTFCSHNFVNKDLPERDIKKESGKILI
jgi:hypothetical protein